MNRRPKSATGGRLGRSKGWRLRADTLHQVVHGALRSLRRTPGLVMAVVAVFALGIGANATMFGALD
jgi:hypothetical protein